MPVRDQILQALASVRDPEIGRPITELDMVREVTVGGDGDVRVEILLTIAGCPMRERLEADVRAALEGMEGIRKVRVDLGVMTEEQRTALVTRLRGDQGDAAPGHEGHAHAQGMKAVPFWGADSTTRALLIASGKGGVGKSSITANLAVALAEKGLSVGVVDADIWGFSLPRMLGVGGRPTSFNGMILPLEAHGVKVISMGFFVPDGQPVIWRGPMLHRALNQFLTDVWWGEMDVILADMPPGTGDIALSIASFLPGAEMVVVTTPQAAAQKVAARAGKMSEQVNLKLTGVIENMSYYVCPHCSDRHRIFGEGGGRELASTLGVRLLGEVPIDERLRVGSDVGTPVVVSDPGSPAAAAIRQIAESLASAGRSIVGKRLTILGTGSRAPTG